MKCLMLKIYGGSRTMNVISIIFPGYRLIAFISHMGTSTMVGHYVCHIFRDGHWVIYNDNKVALSENPPKELGYLYLYQRL
jgi:ubiquitin carboxyl-terminal hydrolase 5/13